LEFVFEGDSEIALGQMHICLNTPEARHRERAHMVDLKRLQHCKCDNIWCNMRHSLEFHNGVTLTAGEKSGLLSTPSTLNFDLVYEETVNDDTHTERPYN